MVRDQEIINHILSKWGEEEEMRALNEQYRYTPPYPTLHLEDFLPEECLQNLYHHRDEMKRTGFKEESAAIFMIGRNETSYNIVTGNYILADRVSDLKSRIDQVNVLDKDGLKMLYKEVLNNEERTEKGGGGLGIIDIARKSKQKLVYDFMDVDDQYSFFSLYIKIPQKN